MAVRVYWSNFGRKFTTGVIFAILPSSLLHNSPRSRVTDRCAVACAPLHSSFAAPTPLPASQWEEAQLAPPAPPPAGQRDIKRSYKACFVYQCLSAYTLEYV